jgi:hypothetical protein
MFEHSDQAITNIRGCRRDSNQYTSCKGKIWEHDTRGSRRHHEWPQFTTTIRESSRAHLSLVHVLHVIPRRAFVGGPHTIPYTPWRYGRVLSNSATVDANKFMGPHKSRMRQYIINARRGPWLTQVGGYHFQGSEHENRPLPDIHIRYSPLSPSCLIRSHIVPHSERERHKPHMTSIGRKGPITSGFWPLIFHR